MGMLPTDLAATIARAGVDPTAEPRPLQDALKSAIADRRGYVAWDVDHVDHVGWVVDLLAPASGQDRERFHGRTLEEALAWCLVWLMAEELSGGTFGACSPRPSPAATPTPAGPHLLLERRPRRRLPCRGRRHRPPQPDQPLARAQPDDQLLVAAGAVENRHHPPPTGVGGSGRPTTCSSAAPGIQPAKRGSDRWWARIRSAALAVATVASATVGARATTAGLQGVRALPLRRSLPVGASVLRAGPDPTISPVAGQCAAPPPNPPPAPH